MSCNEADAVRSARLKGKECRYRGKEVHWKRVVCYAERKINITGRYNVKIYIGIGIIYE